MARGARTRTADYSKTSTHKEKIMSMKKSFLLKISAVVPILVLAVQPPHADPSPDAERLEKLERAGQQFQKRQAALEKGGSSLKKQTMSSAAGSPEGPTKKQ